MPAALKDAPQTADTKSEVHALVMMNFLRMRGGMKAAGRRRPHVPVTEERKVQVQPDISPESKPLHLHDKRTILIVESEGSIFDALKFWHERAYLPAFTACFGIGADPALCGEIWKNVALASPLRGEDPLSILHAALKVLNTLIPSAHRAAVLHMLEKTKTESGASRSLLELGDKNPAEMAVIDWLSMSESLIEEAGRVPHFSTAEEFLRSLPYISGKANVLACSSLAETGAASMWESAGMGRLYTRLAGKERGDRQEFLRALLAGGQDRTAFVVVGSTASMFNAAQYAGLRFYPIVPGEEEESWRHFAEDWFPLYLRGEAWKIPTHGERFYDLVCGEFNVRTMAAAVTESISGQRP